MKLISFSYANVTKKPKYTVNGFKKSTVKKLLSKNRAFYRMSSFNFMKTENQKNNSPITVLIFN